MMKRFAFAAAILALAAVPALANEATFERNLTVNGHVELAVWTGSGHIHITHGSGDRIHIVGHVKSNWGANDAKVQEIANNPPVEQTGNIVRVGQRHENYHNISIDYDIEAPANSFLEANSGSGDISDDGVGQNAKLGTGSGGIHATGLQGGFNVNTGSGNIYAEQTGQGDVKAQTGSGTVELKNVNGSLRAGTGSGNIKVAGSPTSDWKLETGSGSVEFWAGNAAFTLDASTGSGSIHSDPEMTVQGSFDKHHIVGKIHGGGPTVRIETGSGDVRVH
jgi:putative adhesin